jgi:hypothetical protein
VTLSPVILIALAQHNSAINAQGLWCDFRGRMEEHRSKQEQCLCLTRTTPTPKRQITLPSGCIATVREGRGRDLIQAQRAVGKTAESTALLQALVAMLCKVNDQELVYEDVLDMPVADVLMLEAEVLGNFPQAASLMPPVSPGSSTSASAHANSEK